MYRENPLSPQEAPTLAPFAAINEDSQLDAELKGLFIHLFESFIRPSERVVNTSGAPHLGPFEQVEQAVKAEGLALIRTSADQEAMRYVFKSWKARNPKRGLHMLRIYLQMLWPNAWTMDQVWADKSVVYPTALVTTDGGNHYLTSRVEVNVSGESSDGSDVAQVASSLRSVIPARIVLRVTVKQVMSQDLGIASVLHSMVSFQSFQGSFL